MAPLPPVRRVVTGHDACGQAIIEDDQTLPVFDAFALASGIDVSNKAPEDRPMKGGGYIQLWVTDGFPANIQGPWTEYNNKIIPINDPVGTTVRIVDFPPEFTAHMHRTVSIDFGVILSGELELELDNGIKTTLKPGDTIIQRGTIHAWHNHTKEITRTMFFVAPAKPVVIEGKELEEVPF